MVIAHAFVYSVNPVYYVFFTTATLCASLALFGGFYSSGTVQVFSLVCGLLLIFAGVYLLNMSRPNVDGHQMLPDMNDDAISDTTSIVQSSASR